MTSELPVDAPQTPSAVEPGSRRAWWQRVPMWGWVAATLAVVAGIAAHELCQGLRRLEALEQLAAQDGILIFDAAATGRAHEPLSFFPGSVQDRLWSRDTWGLRDYQILTGDRFPRDRLPLLVAVRTVSELRLRSIDLQDADLDIVRRLPHLQSLNLDAPEITPAGLRRLAGSGVTRLRLGHRRYGPDHVAEGVRALSSLTTLALDGTRVGDDAIVPLRGHPNLREVNLQHNSDITDGALAILGTLPRLESLDLCGTKISDAGLGAFPASLRLETLNLSRTAISDDGLARLMLDPVTLIVSETRVQFAPRGVAWIVSRKRLRNVSARQLRKPLDPAGVAAVEAHGITLHK